MPWTGGLPSPRQNRKKKERSIFRAFSGHLSYFSLGSVSSLPMRRGHLAHSSAPLWPKFMRKLIHISGIASSYLMKRNKPVKTVKRETRVSHCHQETCPWAAINRNHSRKCPTVFFFLVNFYKTFHVLSEFTALPLKYRLSNFI